MPDQRPKPSLTTNAPAQVLVLFALGLVALLGVAALGLDGSIVFWQRGRMQNAADGATAAGLSEMAKKWSGNGFCRTTPCATVASVQAAANTMARANGLDATRGVALVYLGANKQPLSPQPTSGNLPAGTRGLRTTATVPYQTIFAGVVGIPTYSVSAQAAGLFGGVSTLSVFPMGVGGDADTLRNDVTFRFQGPSSGGNCGSTCVNYLMFGTLPNYGEALPNFSVTVGGTYGTVRSPAENGRTTSAATRGYIEGMLAADTTSTCNNYVVPNPRIVYVPQVQPDFSGAGQTLRVIGFRAFMFTGVFNDRIEGCWVNVNAAGGVPDPGAPYGGITAFRLTPP